MIEDSTVLSRNPLADLVQGDVVSLFLEAKGAADYVENDFQLRARQTSQELVEEGVWHLGRVRADEATEFVMVSGHKMPLAALPTARGIRYTLLAEGRWSSDYPAGVAAGRFSFFGLFTDDSSRPNSV